ncbi:hypothetical protein KRP22_002784 [Phytophthora ramorum]|uniref:uncharacterized protein n=1 Tax=Phytophthora ramorum TaxID=164328 RepID=UPI0030A23ABF|nr:hypothetical protein KRP23_667 [Phytophthora ramorum]KAH7503379.1 hypothetical protein KRP22_6431 [Phytophthora ramorum]
MSRRQDFLRRRTFTPSENIATGVNATTDEAGDGSLRDFSSATSEDQEQVALTALSYAVYPDDNCDCITFPDVPDEDIGVWECSDDVFWDRVRVEFSDSSCFELEFPEGAMYPYCEGDGSDQCALCSIELSMTFDDGSSSLASTSSSEDFTTSNSAMDGVEDTTTSSQEESFVSTSSSSSQTSADQSIEASSSEQILASSVDEETSAPPTVVASDSTPVGFKIGRLLTFVMVTILALQ